MDAVDVVLFSAPGPNGAMVTLRMLDTGRAWYVEQDDWDDARRTAAGIDAPGQVDAWLSGDGLCDEPYDDETGALSGLIEVTDPLVATSEDDVAPVWWAEGPGVVPGALTLACALGMMEPDVRAGAVSAHLTMLTDLVWHERDVQALLAGDDEDPTASLSLVRCASCLTDPDLHAEVLGGAVLSRTRELVEALSAFGLTVTVTDANDF